MVQKSTFLSTNRMNLPIFGTVTLQGWACTAFTYRAWMQWSWRQYLSLVVCKFSLDANHVITRSVSACCTPM